MDCGRESLVKLWTDADRSLTICTLLLTGGRHRAWEQHCRPMAPQSSPTSPTLLPPPPTVVVSFNREYAECKSTKTNKAASDATIEARVEMSFACVEWRGITLSPNVLFEIIIAILCCLSDCMLAYYARLCVNVAVNWSVPGKQCDLWASR